MPQPKKDAGVKFKATAVSLHPKVFEQLDAIAIATADGNRSAVVSRLIQEETVRRQKRVRRN